MNTANTMLNNITELAISPRLAKNIRRNVKERIIELILMLAALSAVFTTFAIVAILLYESFGFFETVSLIDFFTDTQWTPLFEDAHYGIMPLVAGTLTPHPASTWAKVALLFVTPLLQIIYPDLPGFNMLSAGLVMGVMIVPYIASVAEDAMRAVPMSMREGSYAMGATRFQTALRVVTPAATSGIVAAYILAISRAVGETMVVAVAAGQQPNLTFDPTEGAATITAYIVQVAMGDLPHASIGYQSIFAAGLVLFAMTLIFNLIGHIVRKKFREQY